MQQSVKSRMNILIVIKSLKLGGAERQVIVDANLLSKYHNIFLYVNKTGELLNKLEKNVVVFEGDKKSIFKTNIDLLRVVLSNNIDIIFAHMYWAQKNLFLSSIISYNTKVYFFEHGLNLWKNKLHIIFTRLLSIRVKRILVVSNAKKKIKIKREGFSEKKILVIYNCFNPSEVKENPISLLNFTNGKFVIGFVGRFNKIKQIHLIVELADYLKKVTEDFIFVLVGSGPELKNIKKLIISKKLEKYFYFTGYKSNPIQLMKKFDVFILPSKIEDLSLSLIEAGSVGLPSIAFDVGGNNEIISHKNTGFIIPPYDIKLFAEKILFLKTNPNVLKAQSVCAKEYIYKKFSKEIREKQLLNLINKQ